MRCATSLVSDGQSRLFVADLPMSHFTVWSLEGTFERAVRVIPDPPEDGGNTMALFGDELFVGHELNYEDQRGMCISVFSMPSLQPARTFDHNADYRVPQMCAVVDAVSGPFLCVVHCNHQEHKHTLFG